MGFLEYLSVGAAPAPAALEVFPGNAERWSDAGAWATGQPGTGDAVTIEAAMTAVGVSVQSVRAKAQPVFPERLLVPSFQPDRRPRTAIP